jgi:hypothetical protein
MGGAIGAGLGGAGADSGIRPAAVSGSAPCTSSDTASAPTRLIASFRRPRTSSYAFSGNDSINLRRRRMSNSAAGDAPVTSSSLCSSARTSASVKSRVSIAFKTLSNTEVSATGVALAGPSAACVAGSVDVNGCGAGAESGVLSGEVSEPAFCASVDAVAGAAVRSIASLRRPSTFTCACSGNGSYSSQRRSVSNSSVGDAPFASSRFSCHITSA